MKFSEFMFRAQSNGDFFTIWNYRCACGRICGTTKIKNDVKEIHPLYFLHLCGGWKVYFYHLFKPVFKFVLFLPFLFLWSFWTNTAAITNMWFLIYSIIFSVPIYSYYEYLMQKHGVV